MSKKETQWSLFLFVVVFIAKRTRKRKKRSPCYAHLIPAGFEPATVRLEGECSIQLSYETYVIYFTKKKEIRQILLMIGASFLDHKGTIDLLNQNETHQLMGQGQFSKTHQEVSPFFHLWC